MQNLEITEVYNELKANHKKLIKKYNIKLKESYANTLLINYDDTNISVRDYFCEFVIIGANNVSLEFETFSIELSLDKVTLSL